MSDDEQAPADAEIGWQELQTESGNKYRVKATDYDISDRDPDADESSANGPPFGNVQVFWTVGREGAPSDDVQDQTAITWYKLEQAPWYSPFEYRLTISTQDNYNYSFTDNTNDSYGLNAWVESELHIIDYNSSDPTIVSISGN